MSHFGISRWALAPWFLGKPDASAPRLMRHLSLERSYADKLRCGLQQFMAGGDSSCLGAEVSGIPFMTDAQDEQALDVLKQ